MVRKWIFSGLLAAALSVHAEARAHGVGHCEGFLPKNDMRIPDDPTLSIESRGGITQDAFNEVLDRIQSLYAKEVASHGATLKIVRNWKNAEVNAYADQSGNTWSIHMYGGLARHRSVTADAFAVVACHEMGHHLGGAPKYSDRLSWATNEGQSDYYSTLKCLRRYFERDDNERIVGNMNVDPVAAKSCEERFTNRKDELICIRSTMAGIDLAGLMKDLDGTTKKLSLTTPDTTQVKKTYEAHPKAQCRLDTYFAASLCTVPVYQKLSNRDYKEGSCYNVNVTPKGLRPRCWFKPN